MGFDVYVVVHWTYVFIASQWYVRNECPARP